MVLSTFADDLQSYKPQTLLAEKKGGRFSHVGMIAALAAASLIFFFFFILVILAVSLQHCRFLLLPLLLRFFLFCLDLQVAVKAESRNVTDDAEPNHQIAWKSRQCMDLQEW